LVRISRSGAGAPSAPRAPLAGAVSPAFRSGLDMFVVGLGVAGVGYVIGDLVAKWAM
jgi:hypothetical protein